MDNDYNQDRVDRAMKALRDYEPNTEGADALTDLLTDLRHCCDARGWDFADSDRAAGNHYTVELKHAKEAA